MAKIKFNLNFRGEQIRTLDDLRDNFSIEDVLDVYSNGLLVKWLDVHNHKHELAKVNAIQTTDARGILSELIRIFSVTSDTSEIEESLSVLDYLEERKKFWVDIKAGKFDEIARNLSKSQNEGTREEETHHTSKKTYDELVQEIIDNHLDLHHIYDCLDAITEDYPDILSEKHSELFETLHAQRPLTLYALFAHHGTRPYFVLNDKEIKIEPNKYIWGQKDTRDVIFQYLPHSGYIYDCWEYSKDFIWGVYDGLYHGKEVEALPSVREKLYFINALKVISYKNFVSENDEHGKRHLLDIKHPFLRLFKGIEAHKYTSDDETWHVVEKPDKKFMVFCTTQFADNWVVDSLIASTYKHHLYYRLHHHLELTLPIFEGIDVKTQKHYDWCQCMPFYYMEAR